MTVGAFPRIQHWNINGFRVGILIYKRNRGYKCAACGQRGALNWVTAERKADEYHGMADSRSLQSGTG